MKISFVIFLSSLLITPEILPAEVLIENKDEMNFKIVNKLSKEIKISPNSDYYIKYDSKNLTLEGETLVSYSMGLSKKVKKAIVRAPLWIQSKLARQFQEIDGEEYADLILNINKKFVDEITFSIAHSPLGNVPTVDVLRDNAFYLYENDKWIKYADIVDYDDNDGNYYSTIRYWVQENGIKKQFKCPSEIYYWYVVHPEIGSENAEYIYDTFWRNYLFNHNDIGYPLLKEKLSKIEYLWDCESYSQSGNRQWKWSIENHPTAIEVVSYWTGKTVPVQALGDRPVQPNIIAHEHNGWCGELQMIAAAALRAALVPSVGVSNNGEDHAWRDFYERGWHQNDNWWADSGGTVDMPDVYAYGWGKDMSAIFARRGDDSIFEVTSRYIHPEDRSKIKFVVKDSCLQPVDGARITAVVCGPKDITWIKNIFSEKIDEIWDRLPILIKGKILQMIYNRLKDKLDEIPDSIDAYINSIWNFTDMNGECTLELGNNRDYLFIIQHGNLKEPFQLAKYNKLRIFEQPITDKEFHSVLFGLRNKIIKHNNREMPNGPIIFDISYDSSSYQLQGSVLNIDDIGEYRNPGKIDFFMVDETNFKKYKEEKKFNCYNFQSSKKGYFDVSTSENDWYIVFRNNALKSYVNLNFSIDIKTSTSLDKIRIVTPETCVFSYPKFDIGTTINISGIATNNISLYIRDIISEEIVVNNCNWWYRWDTFGLYPGSYLVTVKCGDVKDELLIKLIDVSPPDIKITKPLDKTIFNQELIEISGTVSDNFQIKKVEVCIDNETKIASGTHSWSVYWNLNEFSLGDYKIKAKAYDKSDIIAYDKIQIAINESGCSWGPIINEFFNEPQNPTNTSNVIIYANVTTNYPFNIDRVVLNWNKDSTTKSDEMFRYGENPIQERHEEDPLKELSNEPIYGFELGQFTTGTIINFWITAVDNANNTIYSEEKSFTVGTKQSLAFVSSKLNESKNKERSIIKIPRISNKIFK